MFFIVLFLAILLGLFAVILIVQNLETLVFAPVHLTLFSWRLPGVPVVLLCALCAFLSALLLYVSVVRSARRDKKEIKHLQARIEELEKAPAKSPSGGLINNFAPPVVPMPGFASGAPGGAPGPAGPLASGGPGPRQNPSGSLANLSPSASGNNLSLPPRPFSAPQPPQSPQQMGGPRPPFPHS